MDPLLDKCAIDFEVSVTELATVGATTPRAILKQWQVIETMVADSYSLPEYQPGTSPRVIASRRAEKEHPSDQISIV